VLCCDALCCIVVYCIVFADSLLSVLMSDYLLSFHCIDVSGSNESQLGSIATFDTRREREREKDKDIEKDSTKERGKLVHEGSIRSVFSSSHASFESYSFQNGGGVGSAVLDEASVSLSKAPATGDSSNLSCATLFVLHYTMFALHCTRQNVFFDLLLFLELISLLLKSHSL
jgi:hypothetical protein